MAEKSLRTTDLNKEFVSLVLEYYFQIQRILTEILVQTAKYTRKAASLTGMQSNSKGLFSPSKGACAV